MTNPWFKLWGIEYLSDPKISSLNPLQRSCWITLLCLASCSTVPGKVEYLTQEVLLEKSGFRFDPHNPNDSNERNEVLQTFVTLKMITLHEDKSITIMNWEKRQARSLTNAERQAKYRENKKNSSNENVTGVTTKVTLEKKRKEKKRKNTDDNGTDVPSRKVSHEEGLETPNDFPVRGSGSGLKRGAKKSPPTFNPLGSEIIKAFETINPACKRMYNNTTQRQACDDLIKEYTLEIVLGVIKVLPKTNEIEYLPTITSPKVLFDKWASLKANMQKLQSKNKKEQEKQNDNIAIW